MKKGEKLCQTCRRRPAVAHYWDKRNVQVHRVLKDHDECRQCHRARTDRQRAQQAVAG